MIALDTNLVIRHLIEDDERQTRHVRALLEHSFRNSEKCLLLDPVLCELEWVLTSSYKASKSGVVEAVRALLEDEMYFVFEDRDVVEKALEDYSSGQGDLSDHLLGKKAEKLRASTLYTFDKALRQEQGFTLLGAEFEA